MAFSINDQLSGFDNKFDAKMQDLHHDNIFIKSDLKGLRAQLADIKFHLSVLTNSFSQLSPKLHDLIELNGELKPLFMERSELLNKVGKGKNLEPISDELPNTVNEVIEPDTDHSNNFVKQKCLTKRGKVVIKNLYY